MNLETGLFVFIIVFAVLLTGIGLQGKTSAPFSNMSGHIAPTQPANSPAQKTLELSRLQINPNSVSTYLPGHTPALSFIRDQDCSSGYNAYYDTILTQPDVALEGPGWINPITGNISGNLECPGTALRMSDIVNAAHTFGGYAYLVLTICTTGGGCYTGTQASNYIARSITSHPEYITNIVQEASQFGYDGVIVDIQGIDGESTNITSQFVSFTQMLRTSLSQKHMYLGVALMHKTSDHDAFYKLNQFQDWANLQNFTDFIIIKALDQSYYVPGPTASLPYLEQLLSYTLKTMPKKLADVVWELPLYPSEWQDNSGWVFEPTVLTYNQALLTMESNLGTMDPSQSSTNDPNTPHIVYTANENGKTVKHALWFQTDTSLVTMISAFYTELKTHPEFGQGVLQTAWWIRTQDEPLTFWQRLDQLY